MSFRKLMLGAAAAALVVSPALAQAAFAPSVAPLNGDESEVEGGSAIILGLAAAAAIIGGIVLATSSDDAELPISG
jgi:hypothetical protein